MNSSQAQAQEMVRKDALKKAKDYEARARQTWDAKDWDLAADFYEAAGFDNKALVCRTTADNCRGVE